MGETITIAHALYVPVSQWSDVSEYPYDNPAREETPLEIVGGSASASGRGSASSSASATIPPDKTNPTPPPTTSPPTRTPPPKSNASAPSSASASPTPPRDLFNSCGPSNRPVALLPDGGCPKAVPVKDQRTLLPLSARNTDELLPLHLPQPMEGNDLRRA
jgi:hypothetical protein